VRERPPALAREVVRAFSIWFRPSTWRRGSTGSGAAASICSRTVSAPNRRRGGCDPALKSQGLSAAQVLELIGSLSIEPVFAPHSTEASRRTLLRKQQRIAQRLLERLDPTLTPNEARSVWNSIRMELTAAWQTEELPRERLTVADEREQILF